MKFTGFEDWIEIFRGGKQVDSRGNEHDGDEVIDQALASFNVEEHEPPLTVGHPEDNSPAFGWVEGLKDTVKDGVKVLMAKFRQVVPEFEDMVKKGLFKKRSASFYPDGRLRHVGFLGAAPPAVKGLAGLKFKDPAEAVTFDFYDAGMNTIAGLFRKLRDWLIEKEGKEAADAIIPDWDVEYIREEAKANKQEIQTDVVPAFSAVKSGIDNRSTVKNEEGKMQFKERIKNMLSFMGVDVSKVPDDAIPDSLPADMKAPSFSEADIEAARKKAADDARIAERRKVEVEFAEKDRQKRQEARQKEISTWCDTLVEKGRIAPSWVKYGLPEVLNYLAAIEDVIEFGETKEKATYYDRLKGLFETEIPKIVEFKEIATRDTDMGAGSAGEKLEQLTRKKMADNKDQNYTEAFSAVQREHPGLAVEYRQEISG